MVDPLQAIQVLEGDDRFTYANSLLEPNETQCLAETFQQNKNVFAWTYSDVPGIHPSVASHRLNILPVSRLVRQKIRRFHPNRQKIIQSEVDKFLAVGFIREVEYPEWLANVVVVPKK